MKQHPMNSSGALALVVACLSLQGCASVFTPMGAENYDCNRKENPGSPYCHSFRSVSDGTNGTIPDSRYDAAVKMSDVDRLTGIAPASLDVADPRVRIGPSTLASPAIAASPPAPAPPTGRAAEGSPVRVAPLVQRTWVKRHVEAGDRLVSSTYLYTEVTAGHWQGFAPSAGRDADSQHVIKPHTPPDGDNGVIHSAAATVKKAATGLFAPVLPQSLTQPGVIPGGEVVAPPVDGASMPQ